MMAKHDFEIMQHSVCSVVIFLRLVLYYRQFVIPDVLFSNLYFFPMDVRFTIVYA